MKRPFHVKADPMPLARPATVELRTWLPLGASEPIETERLPLTYVEQGRLWAFYDARRRSRPASVARSCVVTPPAPARVRTLRDTQRRLAELQLEGSRPATAAEQASVARADRRARS